jgi:adenine-specific DNA-methyltransferase
VVQKNKTMAEQDFIKAGFTVVGTENNENKLLRFLKENYPSIIKDNEIDLQELKAIAGLPIDEKVNGYGLNFVGRNFARAKYAQKTEKELRLNTTLSKNIDTTENLVLKGDNLDSLKILKNHYSGKIKCIYIDPPYNTTSDEFVYPDKFDKEEAEVLGLANLSESDFARMDFSFKTKKSHNGWLAFMYPRLLLARDLLSKDGVIFISIDDNEQANLKLLCDEIFGEENFIGEFIWIRKKKGAFLSKKIRKMTEYILCYQKLDTDKILVGEQAYTDKQQPIVKRTNSKKELLFPKNIIETKLNDGLYEPIISESETSVTFKNKFEVKNGIVITELKTEARYVWSQEFLDEEIKNGSKIYLSKQFGFNVLRHNQSEKTKSPSTLIDKNVNVGTNEDASSEIAEIFNTDVGAMFDYAKPTSLVKYLASFLTFDDDIILDFFAGSGTTGQAVMQLNAEDGGNRKFILCQIDEPIKEDKPAYKFCIDNNLPPVISSITIERLKRAGEKIANAIEADNSKTGLFEEDKKQVPDIGFKVFDSVEAPKLKVDDKGQISITENETDALSRIYNMIFTVGLDEPTQVPEEVVKDCIYKIGNHFYITNSEKITSDDYSNAIKNGKVFIDGWTASLNGTLQAYKEDVKIVF